VALEQELVLDISSAVSSIDEIGARLEQVAQQFSVGLAEALEVLSSIQIDDVDASAVSESIEDAVSEAEAEPVELDVDADTSEAESDIDDLDGDPVVVDVDADTSDAESEIGDLDGETVEITVEADTGDAEAEIDGLAGATSDLGGAASDAEGSTDDLGVSIGGLGSKGLAAAGGIAGLVAGVGTLFESGLTAASSLQSFNDRLGDLAPTIESVEIGSLSTTIGQLAQDLGSSDEAVRGSIARLVEFGEAAGATDAQLEETSDQFLALAARAVSLNPELGDIGDVIQQLQGGLAKGGRKLASFGIELTAAEIEARALADTGKLTNTELTEFDKAAAGASLAAEQLGDSLTGDITDGTQNIALDFQNLQQIFGDTIEDLGKPLVVPILDVLDAALPVVTELFAVIADVAVQVAPALGDLFSALSDIGIIEAFGFVLENAASTITVVAAGISTLTDALGPVAPAIGAIGAALLLLNVNPIFAAITAVGIAGTAIKGLGSQLGFFGGESRDLEPVIESLEDSILGEVASMDELADALGDVTAGVEEFLRTSEDSKLIEDFGEELAVAGVTVEELAELMEGGADAAGILGTRLADAGADGATLDDGIVTLTGDSLELVDAFREEQEALGQVGKATLEQLVLDGELSAEKLQAATTTATLADGTVDYTAALQNAVAITAESSDQLAEQEPRLADSAQAWVDLAAGIQNGTITSLDYAAAAEQLGVDLITVETFADQVTAALDAFASTAVSALPSVADALGDIEEASDPAKLIENLAEQTLAIATFQTNIEVLLGLGLDNIATLAIEQGPAFTNELVKALQAGDADLVAALEAQLGAFETQTDATAAFLTDEATPQLVDATTVAADAVTETYRDDLDFSETTAAETGAAAEAITVGTPEIEAAAALAGVSVEEAYSILDLESPTAEAVDGAEGALETGTTGLDSAASAAGASTAGAFEDGADFEAGIRTKIGQGRAELEIVSAILLPAAISAGRAVGRAFGDGIALGIAQSIGVIQGAARASVRSAETAAKSEAGIRSPSTLFAEIGEDLGAGIAVGLAAAESEVVREAEAIVANAAALPSTLGATAAPGGGGGGITVGSIDVEVVFQGGTPSEAGARAAGVAVADGIALRLDALAQRGVVVDARIG
jgi:hypothetical protein